MISVKHVSKTFGAGASATSALDDVSLEVARGEIFGVIGQSGAGKSTLIRSINLLERPSSGTVTVDGDELTRLSPDQLRLARRKIGMVFQHFNLLAGRTAQGNVDLGLEIGGVTGAERRRRSLEILDLVGLSDKVGAYPAELSGDQKQRSICRALRITATRSRASTTSKTAPESPFQTTRPMRAVR